MLCAGNGVNGQTDTERAREKVREWHQTDLTLSLSHCPLCSSLFLHVRPIDINISQNQTSWNSGVFFGAYISMFISVTFHIYGSLLQNIRFTAFLCKWILPKLHWELLLLLYAICKIPKAIKSPEFKIVTVTIICQKTICSSHVFPREKKSSISYALVFTNINESTF